MFSIVQAQNGKEGEHVCEDNATIFDEQVLLLLLAEKWHPSANERMEKTTRYPGASQLITHTPQLTARKLTHKSHQLLKEGNKTAAVKAEAARVKEFWRGLK